MFHHRYSMHVFLITLKVELVPDHCFSNRIRHFTSIYIVPPAGDRTLTSYVDYYKYKAYPLEIPLLHAVLVNMLVSCSCLSGGVLEAWKLRFSFSQDTSASVPRPGAPPF